MRTRKTIGLFLEGDDTLQEGIITKAVLKEATDKDYNVLIFHSLMKKPAYELGELSDEVVSGEGAIYAVPDYRMFDGIIILGEVLRSDMMKKIIGNAARAGVPVIDVNDTYDGCYHIGYNDTVGMKKMVLHLIRTHHCRNIYFMSGFKGNKESEDREEAYRSALEEEGIPFRQENIGYGQFYLKSIDVVREYLSSHDMPDAFVCANDTMAMFVIKYLNDHGYRVPEDVIVTGFDHTKEASEYQPSISSVERSLFESGTQAVRFLEQLWEGKEVPLNSLVPAHLVLNQSCGCTKHTKLDLNRINQEKLRDITRRDMFIHHITELWRDVSEKKSVENMLEVICSYLDFFDWDAFNFCICDDIITQGIKRSKRVHGYSQNMTLVKCRKGKPLEMEPVFYPDILPPLDLQGKEGLRLSFVPLYLNQRTVGYLWISAKYCMQEASMVYAMLTVMNSAIIDLCLLKEKDTLVDKLDSMYVRDELTKLYNRFGMRRFVEKIMKVAKRDNKFIMCIELDLDGLKKINDTYGHDAGDNAIVQVANAMRQASERREVCIRSGGDEYLVFGIAEREGDAGDFIQRVEEYLEEYNERNSWPYEVSCSCGYCVHPAAEVQSLEEMVTEADKLLYQVKARKKTIRIS